MQILPPTQARSHEPSVKPDFVPSLSVSSSSGNGDGAGTTPPRLYCARCHIRLEPYQRRRGTCLLCEMATRLCSRCDQPLMSADARHSGWCDTCRYEADEVQRAMLGGVR